MKDYPVGHRFHDGQTPLKVSYPINLNHSCYGCFYRNKTNGICNASTDLLCAKPSRIFIEVKSVLKVKKKHVLAQIKSVLPLV